MPRFAANLSMLYNEYPFLERFAAAAQDGFEAVEYLFPYDFDATELRHRLDAQGLAQVLFNAPPGDWAAGERGIACLPGREDEFKRGLDQAIHYAEVLGCPQVHVMAGCVGTEHALERHEAVYLANLAQAAEQAAAHGLGVLIEPINTRDMPGYFLNVQGQAQRLREQIGAANLKVQFDMYHCQIMEGDLTTRLARDMAHIGHIQIAGVPDRHEPDSGEVNLDHMLRLIDQLGYSGWVGCEYRPRAGTREGLGWLAGWRH